ncbi:MAG: histidine phosphatase family protein [Clostridia bacterium]|nr:histidine phosphatase family protein [Clostridia bacterium]
MLLYVIRHGDPIYDPDTLTPKGKLQAAAMGKRLAIHGVDRVFVSPNGRARETCQPTCDLLGLTPTVEPWTSEDLTWRDFSRVDEAGRRNWAFFMFPGHILRSDPVALGDRWYESRFFDGTNAKAGYERVQREADAFLLRLGYQREGEAYRIVSPSEERVALFCHQGFGLTFLSHLLAIQPVRFWTSFDISHSCLTVLRFANHADGLTVPTCLCLSDMSHLARDGLPMIYNNRIPL